jgi:hypothetical protein
MVKKWHAQHDDEGPVIAIDRLVALLRFALLELFNIILWVTVFADSSVYIAHLCKTVYQVIKFRISTYHVKSISLA